LHVAVQNAGYQITADDKENIDAGEPSRDEVEFQMVEQHTQYRYSAYSINMRVVIEFCH